MYLNLYLTFAVVDPHRFLWGSQALSEAKKQIQTLADQLHALQNDLSDAERRRAELEQQARQAAAVRHSSLSPITLSYTSRHITAPRKQETDPLLQCSGCL